MKVAIIGLGYVGLPLAVAFGAACPTIGFDRDQRKIARLRERNDVTGEVSAEQFAAARELQCTADPAALREADFLIIAVPTRWISRTAPI
jgi:UDP-N-acetyl-D-galactosamine dehydrogenase